MYASHNIIACMLVESASIVILNNKFQVLQLKALKSTKFHVFHTFVAIYKMSKLTHFLRKTFEEKSCYKEFTDFLQLWAQGGYRLGQNLC